MSELIVGRYRGRYLTARAQQFVLLAAPTGADKSVGFVTPNLLNYAESVVTFDMKLESFRLTSLYRQRHGHAVYLWAPFAEDGRTHRWNMLDTIERHAQFRVGDILAIAQTFYPSDCHPREKYWNDHARNLFLALVLYLMDTPELPCTMGELYRQSSGGGKPIRQHLEDTLAQRAAGGRPLSSECVDAFNRFLSASSEAVGNIISTFNAPLLVFANPLVDAACSASDFDLRDVRRRLMTIYLCVPPHRLEDAAVLANIFFSRLISLNTAQLPENDPTLVHECLLLLEELAALGKISALPKSNFYIRAYRLRLASVLQNVAQLVARYGEAEARTLVADHALHIAYPPSDQREAEEYSKLLGFLTEAATTTSTSHGAGAGASAHSESSSAHGRALLLPQELRLLPRHQQIIFPRYSRPILCDKARYYEDHRFLDRLKSVSPTLAALDHAGWRHALPGARPNWAKVRPSEEQIKHAAFVLRELSIELPLVAVPPRAAPAPLPRAAATPSRKQRATPVLPAFKDSQQPSLAEANAIVDAFFAQLPLFAVDDDAATADNGQPDMAPPPAGDTATDAHADTGNVIDLSALDD